MIPFLSLCVLGLTGSLICAQDVPIRLARQSDPSGTDYTDQIRSFSEFGAGLNTDPPPLLCITNGGFQVRFSLPGTTNSVGVVGQSTIVTGTQLLISAWITGSPFGLGSDAIIIHRGPEFFSPDGEYCCRQNTNLNVRRCLTLTRCPALTPLNNGTITYNPENNLANYTCNEGFVTTGTSQRTCNDDTAMWSGQEPTCAPVDCGSLNNPTNGRVTTTPDTTFMSTATYECDTSYIIRNEPSTRTCQADRMWSGTEPTCQALCPNEPLSNGMVSYSLTGTPPPAGTVATYSCNTGYNLSGSMTRNCTDGLGWSGALPVCNITDCGALPDPDNGAVSTLSGTTFSQTATYSCDTGYHLVGSVNRMCQASGNWSLNDPICEFIILSVEEGINFNNSAVALSSIGEGSSALTCNSDLNTCCTDQSAGGQWVGPDGAIVSESNTSVEGFYVSRQIGSINLNRGGSGGVEGQYCCIVPRAGGETTTFCVIAQAPSAGGDAGAIAGGIIAALIAIIGIVIGILVAVMLIRRMKENRYKFSSVLNGDNPPTPAAHPLPTKRYVKGTQAPVIVDFPVDTHATEGEEVYFRVKATGHPQPSLTWFHNGEPVVADYATELDDDGGLTFPSVEAKHAGVYKLVVRNDTGNTEKQLQLTISDESETLAPVSSSHVNLDPIPVDQLGSFVTELHANSDQRFKDSYKALDSGERGHAVTVAKIPANKARNRFGNIAVYDDNRIQLQPIADKEDCQTDYINACYLDGYTVPRKFIASQGPKPKTLVDFWRLIWQERPPIIVMLTNLKEGNKIKCQQYWPDSGAKKFGPFTVTITDQQIFADYVIRTLNVSLEGNQRPFKTTQFHFTTWPDHGVPDYATPILGFHRRVQSQHKPSKGPLLVHCSAGVGRTGTYIVIDNVLDQIAAEGLVDISGAIVKARNQRMKMVQTPDQYIFIHDAILESITCGDTQISAGDLRNHMQRMSKIAPGKSTTGYQYQYQILDQVSPNPKEVVCTVARGFIDKNRGNKYLPPDKSRVVLSGEQPDYIHAVFAHGYKHQRAYIIAQNPLPSTIRNLWKVIHDRKCGAIVMLTPRKESGKEACAQYWPEAGQVVSFGEYTVDNLGEEAQTGFTIRQLSVLNTKNQKALQVTQFQILNWNKDGTCENFKAIIDVNEEVTKVQRRTGNKSLVVHCSDTVTRSGMYCSIATIIDRCKTEGVVDVFQVVKALRTHKPGAVPSLDNYKAIFQAIVVYLDSFDTYANFQ